MDKFSSLLFPLGLLAVMYFLMIRPQQQQAKRRNAMLAALERGNRIITIGGIHGTIMEIKPDDTLLVKISDKVDVVVNRTAVGAVKE